MPTQADFQRVIYDQAMEIEQLKSELSDVIETGEQLEAEVAKLQRKMALREQAPKDTSTPHYLPGAVKNGRPIILETLQHVASVCGSGGQFSKV